MSALSTFGSGLRHRKALLLLATALLLAVAALAPTSANAAYSQYWNDGSQTRASAGCVPKSYNYPVSRTWMFHAGQNGLDSALGIGYPTAHVAFAIWSEQRRAWVAWDTSWNVIQQTVWGYSGSAGWSWGAGTFSVYAAFLYRGTTTEYRHVGWMRWVPDSTGRLLCFDY